MFFESAVANDIPPVTPADACGSAAAASYSFGRYTHIQKAVDPAAFYPAAPSIAPEMWAAPDGKEQALYRLLVDEVESVNRLYKVVSQLGCDVVFYSETGELTGRYGKPHREAHRLPSPARSNGFATACNLVRSTRPPSAAAALASPIFDPEGSLVGSLGLSSTGDACAETVADVMQVLVRMTAHAVEERAFRRRYAREWIVALAPPDRAPGGVLLAVNRDHRVVGADRRARTTLLQNERDAPRVTLWSLFEKNPTIFRSGHVGDMPVVLTRLGTAERWSALVTPPASDRPRLAAGLDAYARPRLDLLGCLNAQPNVANARGGLSPRALKRVRDYIDASLTDNITLESLADVAGLSRCHFARAFKQSVGTSPHAYLMQRRLERAERLLAETEFSLCQVALDSGFADQSHFSSCFRKHFGVSPRSFRRAQR